MSATYSKTCLICPHCGEKTDSSIDHLTAGDSFGPWFCDDCGGGFSGVANGARTELVKSASKLLQTLDLLVLPPQERPVFFVVAGVHSSVESDAIRFLYEEHSCPINWIGDAVMVVANGDPDPHGLLKFVRAIPRLPSDNKHSSPVDEDNRLIESFPELVQATRT